MTAYGEKLDLRGFNRGPRTSFGEAVGAGFRIEREQMWTQDRRREAEALKPLDDFLRTITSGERTISEATVDRLLEQDFDPDDELLQDVLTEAEGLGYEIPDQVRPDALRERRETIMGEAAGRVAEAEEVLGRAGPFSRNVGAIVGGIGAGATDPVNLATLPVGAPARAGLLGTVLIEAGINAAIEAAQTPGRNVTRAELGMEAESVLQNAAFGALLGGSFAGAIKGAEIGFRQLGRLGRLVPDRRALIDLAERSGDEEARSIAQQLKLDMEDEEAATDPRDRTGVREHLDRAQAAATAAQEGGLPDMPARPTFATPRASIISGEIEEVDPRELEVQPKVFQFKSDADEAGVTAKLRDVPEWRSERAGIVLVYEYADGTRAVADGHQRTALARRIMEQGGQEIRLAARVYREMEGFTAEDVRVLAALKNIAEAADGMTTAMARDAAKVLRVDPEAIRELPAGPGIARAQSLSRLSDEAFDMFINEVVPERFAELVGRMVENPEMHAAMMTLLRKTRPETTAQAESILAQALEAPVEREITADLFGEQEIVESLYLERAKVLERAMRLMRDDRSVFRTLDERAERIVSAGRNRLDEKTNRETRQQVEQAMGAVQQLAHRAGPISEALNDGAKAYKQTGRLKDAAQSVVDAVRREIERNGLAGAGAGAPRRDAKSPPPRSEAPDALEGFADPVNGEAVDAQIANTRIDANERPADNVTDQEEGLADLRQLIARGASRQELDNHPVVVQALAELEDRASRATNLSEGYGSDAWHETRQYEVDGQVVTGTAEALPYWIDIAHSFAGDAGPESGRLATIVLGPPAAGKSTIAEELAVAKRAAILDSDEIKKTLPEFEGGIGAARVHEESSDLGDLLEAALRSEGTNVVFPKVGGSPGSIRKAVERFKADGYTVEIVNMDVSPENAYRRMIGRFAKTGRIIPPAYLDAVGTGPSQTYRTLKEERQADGFAEIDNNGGIGEPKPVTDTAGRNPLAGSPFDLPEGGRAGDVPGEPGAAEDPRGAQTELTPAGEQMLMEGVEAITEADRLAQRAAVPMDGGAPADDTQIGGLFDPGDPSRFDLFDAVPVSRGFDDDGNEIAIVKTRADMAAELDADDEAVEVLDLCVKG